MEVFKGINGNKGTYLIFAATESQQAAACRANERFKVSKDQLKVGKGWVWNDQLFLKDPKVPGADKVIYVRRLKK